MSYGALLLQLIRQHLNELLSPDTDEMNIENMTANTVKENLHLLYDQTIDKCEATLNEWLTKPSEVEFFMFEEFSDRILFAEGMRNEWSAFLDDDEIRSKIWIEFRQIEERKHLQMSWKNQVTKTMIPNQELVFL
jgi:hypothetical protein